MLEGLAAWVLNTYVGEYIENLNTDQLSIGLLQGEVELENLPLKRDAFKNFNLPIQVLSGYVGKIRLQIPFRRLRSEPWVISLEQLYIIVGPVSPEEFDDETRENQYLEKKLLELDRLEQQWRAQFDSKESPSYYSTSYSSWLSYGNSFISSIVDNVQLKIDDVHVRYEDNLTDPQHPFSFGIILNGLSAQSTDKSWVPRFVIEDESNISRKLVELLDLAIYWDQDSELFGDLKRDDFYIEMERLSDTSIPKLHNYIMEPVSAEAKISRNCQPESLKSRQSARLSCDLLLDKIPFALTNVQFENIMMWVKEFERLDKSYKHSKLRPKSSVKDHPREWWNYAISHHLDGIRKRNHSQTLTFIVQRSRDVVLYSRAYHQYLSGKEPLTTQMKDHKIYFEKELPFEELRLIRQAVMDKYSRESFAEKASETASQNNQSLLQQWFPAWTGWYAGSETADNGSKSKENLSGAETELDKEILNVLTQPETEDAFMRKDFLSCSINFCLRQGTLTLLCQDYNDPGSELPPNFPRESKKSVFELEFSNLFARLQCRSRLSSTMLHLSLGGLYVKDKVTAGTAFPLLISPQLSQETSQGGVEKKNQFGVLGAPRGSYSKLFSMNSGFISPPTDRSLFEIIYEVNPIDSTADYKLHICSRSLDIVYCPMAVKELSAFFSTTLLKTRRSDLNLTNVAKSKYETFKKQTKDEIRNTFEQLIEGGTRNIAKWDLLFDVSAPQFIIPSDVTDKNANLVVFDFGKLHFTTVSAQIKKKDVSLSPDSDDEEDFHTPCSTPPEIAEHSVFADDITGYTSPRARIADHSASDSFAHEKMYDCYTLRLCNLQVLVGHASDNWRYAHLRGTSPMHIIERFSISLQLERRIMFTTDPQWPAATLSGSLPKLVVHVNESKVQAFKTCVALISNEENYKHCDKPYAFNDDSSGSARPSTTTQTPTDETFAGEFPSPRPSVDDTKVLMAQFCIDQLVLQIQSRGFSIAELQVTGVKSILMKRSHDSSINLTVHGLLLVDALQTYGPDFELLIASHKHVTMDSVSGSLRDDSETTSPVSPASPSSPRLSVTSQALTHALTNLEVEHKIDGFSHASPPPFSSMSSPSSLVHQFKSLINDPSFHDSEALIFIEYTKVHSNHNSAAADSNPNAEPFQICLVLFNNLDIIANQETIVELLGFVKRVFPFEENSDKDFVSAQQSLDNTYNSSDTATVSKAPVQTELSFDFHRLNVLLLQTLSNNGTTVAQKVATATMSGAKIHATIGKDLKVEGALGGLQLIDLTPDGTTHQRIISAGYDPLSDVSSQPHPGLYSSDEHKVNKKFSNKALNFEINKPDITKRLVKDNYIDVKLQMASVCYVHSPEFLNALQSCASEFQQYIGRLKSSLKLAATEVAIGIVNKRADGISFYGSESGFRDRLACSFSFDCQENDALDGFFMSGDENDPTACELRLNVDLQTPIIVLPKSVSSPEVFVGHLGQITINNTSNDAEISVSKSDAFDGLSIGCEPFACDDVVNVKMSNMNVYSLNITENTKGIAASELKAMSIGIDDLYNCSTNGHLILHDTVIDLKIGRDNNSAPASTTTEQVRLFMKKEDSSYESNGNAVSSVLQVTGCVISPLKVVLTKQQYQQILESLDNLTYDEPSAAEKTAGIENLSESSSLGTEAGNDGAESANLGPSAVKMAIRALFSVPELSIELQGDLGNVMCEPHGLVNIEFNDFLVHYQKDCLELTSIQVSLKSLAMEDLFLDKHSNHRYIMVSYSPPEELTEANHQSSSSHFSTAPHSSFLSKSCPEVSKLNEVKQFVYGSLPNDLDTKNVFQVNQNRNRNKRVLMEFQASKDSSFVPATPPVSPELKSPPVESNAPNTLVHINTILVDKNCADFSKRYNSTNRFIDIDFNCLDTTINVQTWVMVLDFFGIGSEEITDELSKRTGEERKHYQASGTLNSAGAVLKPKENINSEIDLRIRSLSLILNKPEYELTKANISNCISHLTMRSGNFSIAGKLGSMSLLDLSPHSDLYTERFTTSGNQALDFNIFKYGSKDIELKRDCDIKVKLRMSSVCYIHTQRFQAELTAFFQHFTQLQLILNELRAAAVGNLSQDALPRGSRIKLDIKANSPVIVMPMSSHSPEILVIDLGKLVVNNSFIFAGSPGCIGVFSSHHQSSIGRLSNDPVPPIMVQSIYGSLEHDLRISELGLNQISLVTGDDHVCLLDVMNIELEEVNLFSAIKKCGKIDSTKLDDDIGYQFSSFFIAKQGGPLLKKKFILKLQAERNLDGGISHSAPDLSVKGIISSVHLSLDVDQYKLIRGLLAHNLGESLEEFEIASTISPESVNEVPSKDSPWIGMSMNIDLMNVTIELLQTHGAVSSSDSCFAQIDLIRSRLACQSYSDQSKEIDLVSQEILISDTRFRDSPANSRPNIYVNILQPMHSSKKTKKGLLQAEVHYRMCHNSACFTVLVNNMRIMGIFDWLIAINEFVMNNPENPHLKKDGLKSPSASLPTSPRRQRKVTKAEPSMEIKLNIMDTELVVVEDASSWDTNAVILKSTAVVTYKMEMCERPLSCSLQSLEVFSCTLGLEEETALSIIDPVTINVELISKVPKDNPPADLKHILEITMQNLNVRLSYYDMQMFCHIFDSVPKQLTIRRNGNSNLPANIQISVEKLKSLGFSNEDCLKAIESCVGNLDEAAIWLTQNADPVITNQMLKMSSDKFSVSDVEFHVALIRFCLIDDCKDADSPLVELSMSDLCFNLNLKEIPQTGAFEFIFGCDYYNRQCSAWEPCIEPWSCKINFSLDPKKVYLKLKADDTLNVNVTSSLLEIVQNVHNIWTEDYYSTFKMAEQHCGKYVDGVSRSSFVRKRSPFVPYALKNETGCQLKFMTYTTTPTKIIEEFSELSGQSWIEVEPGKEVPFIFESRTKMRHVNTHELKIHQIVVQVAGWKSVMPVSVDKVGTYFRYMKHGVQKNVETRILFCISLKRTARKLITVKSALSVINKLQDSIEMKLESLNPWENRRALNYYLILQPNAASSLPVNYVNSSIWIRPSERSIGFCNRPLKWQDIGQSDHGLTKNESITCFPTTAHLKPYKFCVQLNKLNYPADTSVAQPGHCITLQAPITIVNLLPCDLKFRLKGTEVETGSLKAGKEGIFTSISVSETVEVLLNIENFSQGSEMVIQPGTSDFLAKICVYDYQNRPLALHIRVYSDIGNSLKLYVFVPYWFVNKTGLPLMFKQDGMATEVAGQGEEHEMARSVAPLLFSFADPEIPTMCAMRLGKSVHSNGTPLWCSRFHLEKGVRVRPLRVSPRDSRPDWVYMIGVEVRVGRGHYDETHIVTLTPRFQIDNHSSYKLEISQKYASTNNVSHLLSFPKSSLPFHWARVDLEQLLCVRIADIPSCNWSGGIKIDKTDSFHINIRDQDYNIHFIHAEVLLKGATFFIVFTNTDKLPAPYRIDNLSEVPVTFYQRDVPLERLHTNVRAHSSLVYAWDELMLPPYITCVAPGGSSASCIMNKFGDGSNLYYENFIYIAFTGTFDKDGKKYYENCEELVLDSPNGSKIILSKKEPGNRSQLWRMNMQGHLEHEGSSPPQDPRKSSSSSNRTKHPKFVLDLAGIGPQPDCYAPLMLRKSDNRRRSTQRWYFTEDGRLCCAYNNMYVQAKDGFYGLKAGNEVVLGLSQPVSHARTANGVPVEQAIERQRFRGGSGVLSVSVVPDGPTRVLRIMDIKNKKVLVSKSSSKSDWVVVEEKNGNNGACSRDIALNETTKSNQFEFQLDIQLSGGIGLSLINSIPEELVYCILFYIKMNYTRHSSSHNFEMSVENVQVDNQLMKAECPVTLFVSRDTQRDSHQAIQPAILIKGAKNPLPDMNAEIFRNLYVTIKNMTLSIEEILLCKLVQFFSVCFQNEEDESADENNYSSQRNVAINPSSHAKRYYFGILKIVLNVVRLSVLTSSNLPPDLVVIKRNMGWTLMRFEDAQVELDDFNIYHPFETATFLINAILQHYREELKGQAAKILGSIDFLGNPLGLVHDVSEGVSTLLNDGNVGGLLKNVTHGLSNSAAKVTGSLSEGLGKVTMDDHHQMVRAKMRSDRSSSSGEHLVAGLKGFGHGLLGGVTSLITQTYSGASNEGVPGFFSGIGKGLVGTVTKPTVGILDLATGAASAVRDTSRSERRVLPPKIRLPRLCLGPNGALPMYSVQQAHGQEYLYTLNNRDYSESLIAFEVLFSGMGGLKILISNKMVRVISSDHGSVKIVLQILYSDLFFCKHVTNESSPNDVKHFIELTRRVDGSFPGQNALKRPQVRCNDNTIAQKVAQEINYAKTMYEEARQSLALFN